MYNYCIRVVFLFVLTAQAEKLKSRNPKVNLKLGPGELSRESLGKFPFAYIEESF